MQVDSKSLLPNSLCVRGSLPFRAAGARSSQPKGPTMTGVVFLVCVSALLIGSLVISSDA